jgi:DNA-binding transcriptional ArsR family regulator
MIDRNGRTRLHAVFFKALGHPIRLGIMELLARGPMNVGEIQYLLGTNLSNISRHLAVLRDAELVVAGRYGVEIKYRQKHEVVEEFQKRLDEVLGVPGTNLPRGVVPRPPR